MVLLPDSRVLWVAHGSGCTSCTQRLEELFHMSSRGAQDQHAARNWTGVAIPVRHSHRSQCRVAGLQALELSAHF